MFVIVHTHTSMHACIHTYIQTYIYIYICVCVCLFVSLDREPKWFIYHLESELKPWNPVTYFSWDKQLAANFEALFLWILRSPSKSHDPCARPACRLCLPPPAGLMSTMCGSPRPASQNLPLGTSFVGRNCKIWRGERPKMIQRRFKIPNSPTDLKYSKMIQTPWLAHTYIYIYIYMYIYSIYISYIYIYIYISYIYILAIYIYKCNYCFFCIAQRPPFLFKPLTTVGPGGSGARRKPEQFLRGGGDGHCSTRKWRGAVQGESKGWETSRGNSLWACFHFSIFSGDQSMNMNGW